MNRMQTAGLGLVIVACTVDGTNDDPFGAGTVPAPTTTITTTIDPSTSDGSGSTSGGDDTTTTTTAATTMPASDSSGPDPVGTSDGGSTDGGGDGMQPQDGMYSPCLTPQECGMTPILCITILDAMMNPSDGFCSETGCANPAVDCAPAPGGTAIPRCMPVTVNQMALQACALDCSGGKVCPAPMQCYDLDGVGMVCG